MVWTARCEIIVPRDSFFDSKGVLTFSKPEVVNGLGKERLQVRVIRNHVMDGVRNGERIA